MLVMVLLTALPSEIEVHPPVIEIYRCLKFRGECSGTGTLCRLRISEGSTVIHGLPENKALMLQYVCIETGACLCF